MPEKRLKWYHGNLEMGEISSSLRDRWHFSIILKMRSMRDDAENNKGFEFNQIYSNRSKRKIDKRKKG